MTDSLAQSAGLVLGGRQDEIDALLSGCLRGDESAFQAVYNLYGPRIYRLCAGLLHNREDAEEVLQDAFEYAFRRIDHYDSRKAAFSTWLYQIAVSRCRNKRRRKWLHTLPLSEIFSGEISDKNAPNPAENMMLSERQAVIWKALGELSHKLRETAYLRFYEELTYAEIGRILSIPSKTAESRIRLARAALKDLLSEEFDSD